MWYEVKKILRFYVFLMYISFEVYLRNLTDCSAEIDKIKLYSEKSAGFITIVLFLEIFMII